MLNDQLVTAPADVLVLPMTEEMGPAITAATALRDGRDAHPDLQRKRRNSRPRCRTAPSRAFPFAVLLGEDEIAAGKLSVKNFSSTGEQVTALPGGSHYADREGARRTFGGGTVIVEH